ncbi:helix-turn-helix domain-containing protein [Haladaptatus sp. NG-WS-4]
MSVITEVSIDAGQFRFGEVLASSKPMHIELERVVPMRRAAVPYLWIEDTDYFEFDETLTQEPLVENFDRLDELEGRVLYRIEWTEKHDIFAGITEAKGALMEGHGGDTWKFQLRFDDHEHIAKFYNYCTKHDIALQIDRVYSLTEEYRRGRMFGLTPEQREALLLAANRGYFETPSRTTLDELGAELDISSQALSKRIRGGVEKLVENALLTTA